MDPNITLKPKTMAELLPTLRGFMSKEAMQSYTEKKQPRAAAVAQGSRTAERCYKPMSLNELKATLSAFKAKSTPKPAQVAASNKKKWNSSIKLDKKTTSHTADGKLKHHSVRKTLVFQQPKPPKINTFAPRMTITNTETPKFPKPERKVMKSLLLPVPASNTVRISGICPMPSSTNKPLKSRMTLVNKENVPNQATNKTIITATPKSLRKKVLASQIPDTPLSNASRKFSSDTQSDSSFLQHERDVEKITDENEDLPKEETPDKTENVSLSASTPFRQYRNINAYFNNSIEVMDHSVCQDDTIMSFEQPNKREESVIVSLCDMFKKTNVTDMDKLSTDLDDLLEVEKQINKNIEIIETSIKALNTIKENEHKHLKYVCEQIKKKSSIGTTSECNKESKEKSCPETSKEIYKNKDLTPTVGKPCSVIKSCLKSPSYKIPKKNASSLRKKVCYNSTNSVRILSPVKNMNDKALDMYMNMKGHMNFLSTPAKQTLVMEPDTPSITSHNLQKQLDKLYES